MSSNRFKISRTYASSGFQCVLVNVNVLFRQEVSEYLFFNTVHHDVAMKPIRCICYYQLTLEKTLFILLIQSQQLTGSLTDFSQSVLDAPDLTLVAQTIFANDFQLLVQTSLLIRTTGSHIGLREDRRYAAVNHDSNNSTECCKGIRTHV